MNISNLTVREIFDSRGDPTIEVALTNERGRAFAAQIPSGKSRGAKEAASLNCEDARTALRKTVMPRLVGERVESVRELDDLLIRLDGTPNKAKLGGNLMLGISIAAARSLAFEKNVALSELLAEEFFPAARRSQPVIFSNLINGGSHAATNLDIQEYLVLAAPGASVTEDVRTLTRFSETLGGALRERTGLKRLPIGDEGGYAIDFKSNLEPIALLASLIKQQNLGARYAIGLDAAASQFYRNGAYSFEKKPRTTSELAEIYAEYFRSVPSLASIEDPFREEDAGGFAALRAAHPDKLVIGDDLTATNSALIKRFAERGAVNGVIIKPNQIGTVSETCRAIAVAHAHDLKCVISHRSGETEDAFIIHLARASGAYGVKIGAPVRERISKFNELIRLYG